LKVAAAFAAFAAGDPIPQLEIVKALTMSHAIM
jgi:hypothetical protein